MGLGHVVAPEDHRVGKLDVAVVVGGFINAERLIEAHDGGRHAEAGVRVDVVGAEPALPELGRRVCLGNRVLAGAHERNARRSLFRVDALELAGHFVERFIPGDGLELAVLVELAVRAAHQRLREAVAAVHDLGVEVAFDAVEAAVDGRVRVALRGDDATVAHADLKAAARAAESAYALVPGNTFFSFLGIGGLHERDGNADRHGRAGGKAGLDKRTTLLVDLLDCHWNLLFDWPGVFGREDAAISPRPRSSGRRGLRR